MLLRICTILITTMIPTREQERAQLEHQGCKRPYCRSDTASETQSELETESHCEHVQSNLSKRARFGDPEPSVSVDMSESTKRERLEAEDGLGADGGGKNNDPGKGDIQAAAAIMADCMAIPFPNKLPSPNHTKQILTHRKGRSSSFKLSDELLSKPDDDSSLMPQASPEDIQTSIPIESSQNQHPLKHPSWMLSTSLSVLRDRKEHSREDNGSSRRNGSSESSSSVSPTNREKVGSESIAHPGTENRYDGSYRDTNQTNSESTSSRSGNPSSYDSNQRTQGSSLSQRTNLNGSSMEDSNSTREKQDLQDTSMPSSGDTIFTSILATQPEAIQDEMSALMSDWSLLHIKFSNSRCQRDVESANRRVKKVLLRSDATKISELHKDEAISSARGSIKD